MFVSFYLAYLIFWLQLYRLGFKFFCFSNAPHTCWCWNLNCNTFHRGFYYSHSPLQKHFLLYHRDWRDYIELVQSLRSCHIEYFVFVLVTEGASWGSDTPHAGAEPENQAEAKPLVLGRSAAHQHSKHTSWYYWSTFIPAKAQYKHIKSATEITNFPAASACQNCSAMFIFALFRFAAFCCYCLLTPFSAFPVFLSFILVFNFSLTHSLLYLVFALSWFRFCGVCFPLSTRPCWTGAHAKCFQFLPQIRIDVPLWIL